MTTGSACNSASGEPSYVLRALGRGSELAQSSLRFSFGRGTRDADIDQAAAAVIAQVEKLRRVSPTSTNPGVPAQTPRPASPPIPNAAAPTVWAERRSYARRAEDRAARVDANEATLFTGRSEPDLDPVSPLARKYFDELPYAGVLTPDRDGTAAKGIRVVHGEAGSIAEGTWVRFQLRIADGSVKAALFQAWGCPHTLAVTAWLTGQLPGRSMMDLVPGTPSAWLQALNVPMEKLGRLLVVEDALRAVYQQWKKAP